jgi:MFS family permease
VRYRTILLTAIPVAVVSGTLPYFLKSLSWILVCRAVFGVCYGLVDPLGNALILRHYEGRDRIRFLGYNSVCIGVVGVIFQQLGGRLAMVSWNSMFLGHLIFLLPMLLVLFGLIEPERADPGTVRTASAGRERKRFSPKDYMPMGASALFILVTALYVCSQTKMLTISSIVANEGLGDASTSANILSFATVGAMFGGLLIPLYCDYVKKYRIPILIGVTMAMTVCNLIPSVPVIAAGYSIGIMAFMMNLNLMTLRSSALFPAGQAGRAVSLIQCADKLGSFLATYFTAFCAWFVGFASIPVSVYKAPVIATMLISAVLIVWDVRRTDREGRETEVFPD